MIPYIIIRVCVCVYPPECESLCMVCELYQLDFYTSKTESKSLILKKSTNSRTNTRLPFSAFSEAPPTNVMAHAADWLECSVGLDLRHFLVSAFTEPGMWTSTRWTATFYSLLKEFPTDPADIRQLPNHGYCLDLSGIFYGYKHFYNI